MCEHVPICQATIWGMLQLSPPSTPFRIWPDYILVIFTDQLELSVHYRPCVCFILSLFVLSATGPSLEDTGVIVTEK